MAFESSSIFSELLLGRIRNYLAIDEIERLMTWLMESYGDDLMFMMELGRSHEGRPIEAFILMDFDGVENKDKSKWR